MNSLGNADNRRIAIRQRTLHPDMLGWIDIAESSASDPGRSGSLSPYCKLTSLFFDNSLYENEGHYQMAKYLDEDLLEDGWEELVIDASSCEEYNDTLDKLYWASEDKFITSAEPINPMEIIIEKDPREKYRTFDESFLVDKTDDKEA